MRTLTPQAITVIVGFLILLVLFYFWVESIMRKAKKNPEKYFEDPCKVELKPQPPKLESLEQLRLKETKAKPANKIYRNEKHTKRNGKNKKLSIWKSQKVRSKKLA